MFHYFSAFYHKIRSQNWLQWKKTLKDTKIQKNSTVNWEVQRLIIRILGTMFGFCDNFDYWKQWFSTYFALWHNFAYNFAYNFVSHFFKIWRQTWKDYAAQRLRIPDLKSIIVCMPRMNVPFIPSSINTRLVYIFSEKCDISWRKRKFPLKSDKALKVPKYGETWHSIQIMTTKSGDCLRWKTTK